MTTQTEALRLALEALLDAVPCTADQVDKQKEAIAAIKEALAAPQGEPVAWIFKPNKDLLWPNEVEAKNPIELDSYTPLFAHPAPEPLTDDAAKAPHDIEGVPV